MIILTQDKEGTIPIKCQNKKWSIIYIIYLKVKLNILYNPYKEDHSYGYIYGGTYGKAN